MSTVSFKNFLDFIRFKICIFVSFIAISGYILFNSLGYKIIYVFLVSFFITMGAYAYNNITDSREDKINRHRINPLSVSRLGYAIVMLSLSIGFFFSFFLSVYSILFCTLGIFVSISYSLFRLKNYFLVKNLYTGFGVSLVFLAGASYVSYDIILYYLSISFFIFIGSAISDLRDYTGDKLIKINTMPVSLGYDNAKKIVCVLLLFFSLITVYFHYLIILFPFTLVIFYFLYKNKPNIAHSFELVSFVFLLFWSLI